MRRIILVRHSSPALDTSLPRSAWRLSGEGEARASALAEELRSLRPTTVFTSPERKAHETADVIVSTLGLAPAQALVDLREHDDGDAPFTDEASFRSSVAQFFARPAERTFGAESADEAYARFAAAIAALPRSDASTQVVVSHGRVLSLFIARQRGDDAFAVWRKLTTPWFSVLELES